MRIVVAVIALAACVHAGVWAVTARQAPAPAFEGGQLASISYSPFDKSSRPDQPGSVNVSQIRSDLKLLAPMTGALRTYSSTGGVELVPPIAAEFGLKVTVGAWIEKPKRDGENATECIVPKDGRNDREVQAVIDLARRYNNVKGIVVGNEAIFRHELEPDGLADTCLSAEEAKKLSAAANQPDRETAAKDLARAKQDIAVSRLIRIIQRVKRSSRVPVTTGEIWSVWRDHPELVAAVDYIAVHVLPYWEGEPESSAVDRAIGAYQLLRQLYPGKRIVISEFGWPSAGYNLQDANPGRLQQAAVLRDFVSRAEAHGIDYNIMEAIDQPWKTAEGSVGPYWGVYNADREAKFSWSGDIANPDHWKLATLAILLAVLFSLPMLALTAPTLAQAVLLSLSANLIGAWFATVFAYWDKHYFVLGAAFALWLGVALLIPLVAIAFARVDEIAAIAFGRKPRRLVAVPAPPLAPEAGAPKVSIHIPAHFEPPDMLKATLDSVARLDYPHFECVVVVNNTPEPAFWQPIQEHCLALGERFKFVNEQNVPGFKAGALRLALAHTAPDAEIIGVIDADYVVHPDWLKDLAPLFTDPKVGLVQAPQDHRDGARSVTHHAMNGEYAGFFDIGMVQRNEVNAIITHGTMCLVRRAALDKAGGWSSDTICEDTDLGLTILELGWLAHYTNRRYGFGLLPDTFEAYKKQRYRWAYGGFQIFRKHWRRFLPGGSLLTREQKREFALGWLNWLGAEWLGVGVAILNLLWAPLVAFAGIAIPDQVLTIPIVAAFMVSLLHFITLYRLRVGIGAGQRFGAMVAAMSVQWTVARAVTYGIVRDHLPFIRTAKGGRTRHAHFPAFWEGVLGSLLLFAAIMLFAANDKAIREINIFALALIIQSLPFLAAAAFATIEATRLNEFTYWRGIGARLGELLPRRPAVAKIQAGTDKRVEPTP